MKDTASSPLKPMVDDQAKSGAETAKKKLNMLTVPVASEHGEVPPPPPPQYIPPRDRKKAKKTSRR